ncbi:MAG TPA: hypothetical protein VGN20_07995 [Mucilaginibacter sp.]|jgi:hypothetical protein
MIVNWRLYGLLARGLRWFGIIVGFGLALVGVFFLGYAIFVDTVMLRIPAAPEADYPVNYTPANLLLHQVVLVGTIMGVLTLPFWTILVGRSMLKESPPTMESGAPVS